MLKQKYNFSYSYTIIWQIIQHLTIIYHKPTHMVSAPYVTRETRPKFFT